MTTTLNQSPKKQHRDQYAVEQSVTIPGDALELDFSGSTLEFVIEAEE